MILQVLPHFGRMVMARDSNLCEMVTITNARKHQQLRRIDRPTSQNDLSFSPNDRVIARLILHFNTDGPTAANDHFRHKGVCQNVQVVSATRGIKKGTCGAPSLSIFLSNLETPEATLFGTIKIIITNKAQLLSSFNKREYVLE